MDLSYKVSNKKNGTSKKVKIKCHNRADAISIVKKLANHHLIIPDDEFTDITLHIQYGHDRKRDAVDAYYITEMVLRQFDDID